MTGRSRQLRSSQSLRVPRAQRDERIDHEGKGTTALTFHNMVDPKRPSGLAASVLAFLMLLPGGLIHGSKDNPKSRDLGSVVVLLPLLPLSPPPISISLGQDEAKA